MSKGGGMRSWLRHEGRYSIESVFPQKWTGWRVWKPFIKHGFQRMPKRDVWFLAFGLVLERQVTNHSLRSWKLNVWKLPDVWFQGCCWVVVWPIFFFIPKIGEMIPILTHIFQRGWFNHQLRLSLKQTLLWLHVASLAPLRMKAAIFLDQTCRNYLSMQRGSQVAEANQFKALCDSVALRLALSVLVDIGFCESNFNNGDLLKLGSIPEICFLSLVLRHAREPFSLKLSETMLLAVLRELSDAPATNSQKELCTRFLEETQDAIQSIVVEAYLEKALSTDKPVELAGKPDVLPRVSVLDSRCQRYETGVQESYNHISFLSPLKADMKAQFQQHFLVEELRKELNDLGYLRNDVGIVLSLSGGVDSMVTCCLLWLLEQILPPHQRFRWCAMHLCHPNRDDARDEEGWVQWSCCELGVDLLTYRPQIRRPHGSIRTGISRERYEEKSKQLRFRMFLGCFMWITWNDFYISLCCFILLYFT